MDKRDEFVNLESIFFFNSPRLLIFIICVESQKAVDIAAKVF